METDIGAPDNLMDAVNRLKLRATMLLDTKTLADHFGVVADGFCPTLLIAPSLLLPAVLVSGEPRGRPDRIPTEPPRRTNCRQR